MSWLPTGLQTKAERVILVLTTVTGRSQKQASGLGTAGVANLRRRERMPKDVAGVHMRGPQIISLISPLNLSHEAKGCFFKEGIISVPGNALLVKPWGCWIIRNPCRQGDKALEDDEVLL